MHFLPTEMVSFVTALFKKSIAQPRAKQIISSEFRHEAEAAGSSHTHLPSQREVHEVGLKGS